MFLIYLIISFLFSYDTTSIHSSDTTIQNWIKSQRYYAVNSGIDTSKKTDTVYFVVRNTYNEIQFSNEIQRYKDTKKYIGCALITAGVFSFSLTPRDVYGGDSADKMKYMLLGMLLIGVGAYEISF